MEEQLLETWRIHNRIHLYLLGAIAPEALDARPSERGRTVFELFAHIHNVRLLWLKPNFPELPSGLTKIESKGGSKAQLEDSLDRSGEAVESLLRKGIAEGKVKGFKPHVVAFLGYLIAHESHHRGQIGWALKFSGHPLDRETAFGLWEWGVR